MFLIVLEVGIFVASNLFVNVLYVVVHTGACGLSFVVRQAATCDRKCSISNLIGVDKTRTMSNETLLRCRIFPIIISK